MNCSRWSNKNYDREVEIYRLDKNLKPSKWYAVYKEARFHDDYLDDLETAIEESKSLSKERKHQMIMVLYNNFYDDTYNSKENIKIK
ncbi:MAG: hypothetical protein CMG34_08025 [Candidatus Marinimicrobia bacterium]|jgi:hypothetical protein|nr:hypothetical protein [Candidatus Neomarinimicrobiota bacterium]|tara:strand:+ start:388 stop:648 length:261 start_codon:yes stop_codon:yes gene_type:complete